MKNLNQKIEEGLIKIHALSVLINRKTNACVFIYDMGHTQSLQLNIYKNKKDYNKNEIKVELNYGNDIGSSWNIDSDSRLETIEETVFFLEDVLKENDVNYDRLEPVYEEIISHYLIPNT